MSSRIKSFFYISVKLFFNILTRPVKTIKAFRQVNARIREDKNSPKAPLIRNRHMWDRRCRMIALTAANSRDFDYFMQVIKAFYIDPIVCLRDFATEVQADEVILLAAVKNDRSRIKHLTEHYRKIGVRHFAFIDNGSDDGTVEAALGQDGTACYRTRAEFSSFFKAGWFNRIAAHYGADRWYIVIDSDELLAYPHMENVPAGQYVKTAQSKGLSCVKTVMLDMYPDGILMNGAKSDEEYLEDCVYFDRGDKTGYEGCYSVNIKNNEVYGGMRARLFFEDDGVKLTKPTLLNYSEVFLLGPHKIYPKTLDLSSKHGGAVLHYKFLPSDKARYVQRVKEGTYFEGSRMYKTINSKLEDTPQINAMFEHSVKYDPGDFHKYLPFVEDITLL